MGDALNAMSQIFGTQKLSNANGVLILLFIKKLAVDAFVQQVAHICQMASALNVLPQNIGIIKIKLVKGVLIHLFMIMKNNNVYVL